MGTSNIYKFVKWDVPSKESMKDAKAFRLRHHIDNGGRLTREEKNWITEKVNHNTYFKHSIPVQGWCVPFGDVLKRFLVKQYGRWQELWAIDKTAIRNMTYGRIDEIVALA